MIEIHGPTHGYLFHSFPSPLTNARSDAYAGQSFENRTPFMPRAVKAVRVVRGESEKPLFVRLSASDWAEGPEEDSDGKWLQWGIEQTILLTGWLKKLGVDLIDVGSGGNRPAQKIPQASFRGTRYGTQFASYLSAAKRTIWI
jgi:2,4-dienoyl-CoA reductase-like NADH-dependent reductase (Old Yellow Enzyme family)